MPPTADSGQTIDSPPGPEVTIGERRFLYFGGTGYLDIQRRPELAVAADQAMRRYGLHAATSRLGFGESPPLAEAEREAAQYFGVEAAWLLPSGWVGASVLLDVHHRAQDRLFLDRDAHFALRDAARLVGRPVAVFDHRDPESLRAKLRAELQPGERPVVLTDGVFPISGQLAPLADYLKILEAYPDARMVVDDAHGFGVLGDGGRGTVEFHGIWAHPRILLTGTASKALGGYGGLIPGADEVIRHLRATSSWQAGSTPLPAPVAAATAAALRIVRGEPQLRARLAKNTAMVRDGLRRLGLAVEELPTPIIPLVAGDGTAMQRLHEALRADGVIVPYLSRYTGLGPHGALRIAVFATHESAQIERLLAALRRHL